MTHALLSDGGLWKGCLGARWPGGCMGVRMRSNPAPAPAPRVAGESTLRQRAGEAGRISRLPSRTYPRLDTLRLNLAFPQSGQEAYLSGPTPPWGSARSRSGASPWPWGGAASVPVPAARVSAWTSPKGRQAGRQAGEGLVFPRSIQPCARPDSLLLGCLVFQRESLALKVHQTPFPGPAATLE